MNRLRAALFHNLPPGGALRAAYEMARATRGEVDYVVHRVVEPDRPAMPGIEWEQVAVDVVDHRLRYPGQGSLGPADPLARLWPLLSLEAAIGQAIDDGDFDVAFVHHCVRFSSPSFLRTLRTPSVFYVQEPRRASFEYDRRRRPHATTGPSRVAQRLVIGAYESVVRRIDVDAARSATELLCNSRYSGESIRRAYGRVATYCPLGVDEQSFRAPAGVERHPYVLTVGTLDPSKGFDLVVEALALVPVDRRPALRIVAGRSHADYEAHIAELAARRSVELTIELGLTDAALAARYAGALATIAAAELEPFGLTTIESLACGTPVVAVAQGGFREVVIDGGNGFLTEPTARSLADGIERIVAGKLPVTREQLRAPVVSTWSWERSGSVLIEALQRVAFR